MTRNHLTQIDALRGIAAALVALVFHQHFLTGLYRSGPLDGLPLFTWLHAYGWTMVDLFFVISGFIFSHVYLQNGRIETDGKTFAIARFARLYPLHLLTLLLTAIIIAFGTPPTFSGVSMDGWHFLLNLLMLQESGLNSGFSFNVAAWSISVEVFCYFAFYFLARHCSKSIYWISGLIILVSLLLQSVGNPVVGHLTRGFCGFFAGVIAYRFRSTSAMLLSVMAILPFFIPASMRFGSFGSFLAISAFPAWVILAPRISFLSNAAFEWLGSRSYSIYLVHGPVYWAVSIFIFDGAKLNSQQIIPGVILAATLILLASHVSYRYFEDPMRRWLRNCLSANQNPRRQVSAA